MRSAAVPAPVTPSWRTSTAPRSRASRRNSRSYRTARSASVRCMSTSSAREPSCRWERPPPWRPDARLPTKWPCGRCSGDRREPGWGHGMHGPDVPVSSPLAMMDAVDLPSGTLTFLLSDVEGSTALWEAAREAMAVALPRSLEIVESVAGAHGGVLPVEQGEGDSRLAVFSRAADALAA